MWWRMGFAKEFGLGPVAQNPHGLAIAPVK
jgi:hypothetical protein